LVRRIFIFTIAALISFAGYSAPINKLDGSDNGAEVAFKAILADAEGNLNLDQARERIQGKYDEYSDEQDVYWVAFDLVNLTKEDKRWLVSFDKWTEVNFYENSSDDPKKTGHLIAYDDRHISYSNHNLIEVFIEAGDTAQVLAQLKKSVEHFAVPSGFDIQTYEKSEFLFAQTNKRLLLGLFMGFYLIMLAYNFFIYVSTRDHYYIYYLLILLALLMLTLHNSGYTFELFGSIDAYSQWNAKIQFILSAILGVNIILFTQKFLNLKENFPGTYKVLQFFLYTVILMPIPSFFGHALVNEIISGVQGTTVMIVIMVTAVRALKKDLPSAKYFAIGYGAFCLGIIVLLLSFMKVLPARILDFYPMNIGSSIEMIFFSLALGNRINILRKDNEEKQLKIIEQLQANEELQTKVNRELEEKVRARTKEIEEQKVQIEKQRDLISLEKKKADDLILNILPEETAAELKQKGSATPRFHEWTTVIFTDIVSFTQKAMDMKAEAIVKDLDYCFGAFDDIMKKHNIEKIKTMGDGYMGVGGIPTTNKTHPKDTVMAALDVIDFMKEFRKDQEKRGVKTWGIRIGIHTGPLVAGVVGKNKFQYDVWGDTVNTAARMESSSESGKVNVSSTTYEACKNDFAFEHRGKVMAKNKGKIDMYYVERLTE
jgi:class 3 adenylate cyclase